MEETKVIGMAKRNLRDAAVKFIPCVDGVPLYPDGKPPDMQVASEACGYLASLINQIEKDSRELGTVRATLLVNFSKEIRQKNDYGFEIVDDPKKSTSALLVEVLEKLVQQTRKPKSE